MTVKAVMISIRPKWCEKILNSEKRVELRRTRPKLEPPFKCYIYCTKGKRPHEDFIETEWPKPQFYGGGKVVGEFVCHRIDALARVGYAGSGELPRYNILNADAHVRPAKELFLMACLTESEAEDYLKGRYGFGWHISEPKIYDKPKDLSEFWFPPELYCEKERCGSCPCDQVADVNGEYSFDCEWRRPLMRPPQSWCYVAEEA